MELARATQELSVEGHPEKLRQTYQIVCWMGAAVIIGSKRIATLQKRGIEQITLHEGWHDQALFQTGQAEAEEKLRSAVRLRLGPRTGKRRRQPPAAQAGHITCWTERLPQVGRGHRT